MAFASKIVKLMKKNQRIKDAAYLAGLANGSIKGPLTILHESGVPHSAQACPHCCIDNINRLVAQQSLERKMEREALRAQFIIIDDRNLA